MKSAKKTVADFEVVENSRIHEHYCMMKLRPISSEDIIGSIRPGQFVQIAVDDSKTTYLRRPISICDVNRDDSTLTLLIRKAGDGTSHLMARRDGDIVNMVIPLGNGFPMPDQSVRKVLLVGGGVGVAPLLYCGKELKRCGIDVSTLIGARSATDLLLVDRFEEIGEVYLSTDDGSAGEPGVVTENSVMSGDYDCIYCCGPSPMMKAVARVAQAKGAKCFVSLENMMACGVGACLCCVEKTVRGNVCVCTDGPVFDIKDLTW